MYSNFVILFINTQTARLFLLGLTGTTVKVNGACIGKLSASFEVCTMTKRKWRCLSSSNVVNRSGRQLKAELSSLRVPGPARPFHPFW